jgi:hypothetical protein
MPDEKITATEARQATVRPRAMVLVLFVSLLCLMAGLGLANGVDQSSGAVPVTGNFQWVPSETPG